MSNDRLNRLLEEYRFTTSKWFELQNIIRQLKSVYYVFQRPLYSFLLTRTSFFKNIKRTYNIDRILLNDGGMFKEYVYGSCNRINQIRGSVIFVPGCGYGQHLITLANFKPRLIVACDLYEYPEEWKFVQEVVRKEGTDIVFLKGDIDNPIILDKAPFDWIITDAVLEHVKDLPLFLRQCNSLLKEQGNFYASFGPIWYGPGGDHLYWGPEGIFNHLLLDKNEYECKVSSLEDDADEDSTQSLFMFKNKQFSYLHANEYIDILKRADFLLGKLWIKSSSIAWRYFRLYPEKEARVELRGSNAFDRYCSGMYIWAMKKKSNSL